MSRTALRLDLPTGSWLGDVSRRVPSATLRVDETMSVDGEGPSVSLPDDPTESGADAEAVATVRVAGTDRDRVEDALDDHDRVVRQRVVARRGEVRTLRVVGRRPAYLPAARAVGLPIESTVEVVDGRAAVTVVGDRDRIEAFGRRLAGDGVTVGVAATGGDDPDRTLTEAQRELVFEAVRSGYYDTPRRCTLTELAEANDIAKSTCSETLHRAEGRVMRRFVDCAGPFDATAEAGDATTPAGLDAEERSLDATDDDRDATEFDGVDADGEEPMRSAATEP
ncbi:helix-turn-helix domain-containing protein [Halorubrum tebenquichense]|uniref:Bacterio-opsin activator HTH domain protein n=1 Tax=Halorubrum tebenquichense DSM 14210 TaxID=1227485 RepID=M0DYB4_9EURY|nr:helix-turn-helix domain-containing protein [Halorubrum tebenquichense]ELZ40515.1 Bacterio-opsin activator HTH domain protein [Halorubrum tebenquichense DSM 14210]